jgi:hypothetical protein
MHNDETNWAPELDALRASPEHHKLLFENEHVRVLEVRINPGETTNIHTHKWPAMIYGLSWSDFERYDTDGNIILDSKNLSASPPQTWWAEPIPPHYLKNVGKKEIHNICVEMKNINGLPT